MWGQNGLDGPTKWGGLPNHTGGDLPMPTPMRVHGMLVLLGWSYACLLHVAILIGN